MRPKRLTSLFFDNLKNHRMHCHDERSEASAFCPRHHFTSCLTVQLAPSWLLASNFLVLLVCEISRLESWSPWEGVLSVPQNPWNQRLACKSLIRIDRRIKPRKLLIPIDRPQGEGDPPLGTVTNHAHDFNRPMTRSSMARYWLLEPPKHKPSPRLPVLGHAQDQPRRPQRSLQKHSNRSALVRLPSWRA